MTDIQRKPAYRASVLPLLLLIWACGATPLPEKERPKDWAQPVEIAGVSNAFEITDTLYRGAQPTAEGFRALEDMGIKTVINLRKFHDDKDVIEKIGRTSLLRTVHIPMNAWDVTEKEIAQFLNVVADESNHPIFFHCKHGSDRTGTMAAAYRMVAQGWSGDKAIKEMKNGGYGFHTIWHGLPETLEKLDVKKLRQQQQNTRD
ncbi:MAG: tyrosine-protein phosphatase [Deltaproteobacteria bacterium]|nr:tyrosine-protein phosphatase [Deltaproteobacteria bacterium]